MKKSPNLTPMCLDRILNIGLRSPRPTRKGQHELAEAGTLVFCSLILVGEALHLMPADEERSRAAGRGAVALRDCAVLEKAPKRRHRRTRADHDHGCMGVFGGAEGCRWLPDEAINRVVDRLS